MNYSIAVALLIGAASPMKLNSDRHIQQFSQQEYEPYVVGRTVLQMTRPNLAQTQKVTQVKYDHKFEQDSVISPWVQRDNSWNTAEFDHSDEVQWHNQTTKGNQDTFAKSAYGPNVYPGDGKPTYTFNNQGYSLSQNRNHQKHRYNHLDEQTSIISPYTQRDHSWSRPEFDVSDEVQWANETIKVHDGPAYNHDGIYTQAMTCSTGRTVQYCNQCSRNECNSNGGGTCSWNTSNNQCTGSGGNADPWHVYNNQQYSLAQAKYGHNWESQSTYLPNDHGDHSWSNQEFDMSDEVGWYNETRDAYDVYGYQNQTSPIYTDNNANYTYNNQDYY